MNVPLRRPLPPGLHPFILQLFRFALILKKKTNPLFLTTLFLNNVRPCWCEYFLFLTSLKLKLKLTLITTARCISETHVKCRGVATKSKISSANPLHSAFAFLSPCAHSSAVCDWYLKQNPPHSRTVRDSVTLTSEGPGPSVFVLQLRCTGLFSTMIGVFLKCFRTTCVIAAAAREDAKCWNKTTTGREKDTADSQREVGKHKQKEWNEAGRILCVRLGISSTGQTHKHTYRHTLGSRCPDLSGHRKSVQ